MTVVVIARDPVRRRALIQEAESAGWTVRADVPVEASLSAEDLDGVAAVILDADDAKSDDAKSDDSRWNSKPGCVSSRARKASRVEPKMPATPRTAKPDLDPSAMTTVSSAVTDGRCVSSVYTWVPPRSPSMRR